MSLQTKVLNLKLKAALAVRHANGWQRLIELYGEDKATQFYLHLGLNHLPAKSIDYEGLTLHREPTELEKQINLKAISDAFAQGEKQLVDQLLVLRDKLIADAGKGIIKLSPADYHTLILQPPKQATEDLRQALEAIYARGRKLVLDELRAQGATNLGSIGTASKSDVTFLSELGSVTVSRVANDVQSRAISIAAGQTILGLEGGPLVSRVVGDLQAGSVSYINNAAAEADHAAFGLGRDAEGSNRSGIIQEAYYSAILDESVCGPCSDADGETGDPGEIAPTPNPSCEGSARCRCVTVFILQGEQ